MEKVSILLENKADPNQAVLDDGSTPLFISSRKCHHMIVELLLKHGADHSKAVTVDSVGVQRISEQAEAAAARAASVPEKADLTTVADHRAEIDRYLKATMTQMYADEMAAMLETKKGDTPLIAAIRSDGADVVRMLLGAGADPNQKVSEARGTPLHCAKQMEAEDCVAAIHDYMAKASQDEEGVESNQKLAAEDDSSGGGAGGDGVYEDGVTDGRLEADASVSAKPVAEEVAEKSLICEATPKVAEKSLLFDDVKEEDLFAELGAFAPAIRAAYAHGFKTGFAAPL